MTRRWAKGLTVLCLGVALPASAQKVTVPSTEAEWQELSARLAQNPFLLAAADRETAISVVVAALRSREDGLLWALYGPGICLIPIPERTQLQGEARRDAFQASRDCVERIVADLPASGTVPEAAMVRNTFVGPWAESLVEVGDLVGADTLAATALTGLPDLDPRARGNAR